MNIYDEAIKETTDFGGFVGLKLNKTLKALERAKKVEELAELRKTEKKIIECFINGSYPLSKQHIDIIEQIKALEEELK